MPDLHGGLVRGALRIIGLPDERPIGRLSVTLGGMAPRGFDEDLSTKVANVEGLRLIVLTGAEVIVCGGPENGLTVPICAGGLVIESPVVHACRGKVMVRGQHEGKPTTHAEADDSDPAGAAVPSCQPDAGDVEVAEGPPPADE